MTYTFPDFDLLRHQGDKLADDTIAAIMATPGGVAATNRVLREFHCNEQPIPANLPAEVRHYLTITDCLPAFADPERLARVQEFFDDDGVSIGVVLSFDAMLACYTHTRGARAMAATHRLNYPDRRFAETVGFVSRLMEPDAFGDAGRFIPAAQKVRLIHAAVRYLLTVRGAWNVECDGVPISQEDLLGAMLLFSVYVTDQLKKMGVSVTEQEEADYYHTWTVTGIMLGVQSDLIPPTPAAGREMLALLFDRNAGRTEEGVALGRQLIDYYQRLVPGRTFDGVVPALAAHLLDPKLVAILDLQPSSLSWIVRLISKVVKVVERTEDTNRAAERLLDKAGQLFLRAQFNLIMGGQCPHLNIPSDLTGDAPGKSP